MTDRKTTATRMTFVLGLFCLAILGYATIAYIYLSFSGVPKEISISYFVVRQRTALSALAMSVAISTMIMGFAAFMIEAKGEFKFSGEGSGIKGSLASGVPGLFFVLCGTAITLTVLFMKVSHEEYSAVAPAATTTVPTGSDTPASDPSKGARSGSEQPIASRTVASTPALKSALFTVDRTVFNMLMTVAVEGGSAEDLKYLIAHQDSFFVVLVNWDDRTEKPSSSEAVGADNGSARYNINEGYVLVLDRSGAARCVKDVLQAANSVTLYLPPADYISRENISRILKTSMSPRKVFNRGEPWS